MSTRALIEAVKDRPRDPLKGIERPRARKWLSTCEVGADRVPCEGGEAEGRESAAA